MKQIINILFFLTGLFLISCGNNNEIEEKKTNIHEHSGSPHQIELDGSLKDKNIEDYFKDIYRREKIVKADDSKMISITDSLFTSNKLNDLFYFIVFTKSMNGSDGFYSEAVGHSAFKFVTTKTDFFADYFNIAPKLNDGDMDNWANYIYGEIQIARENQEAGAIDELEQKVLDNIKYNRKEYKIIIEKLIEKIRKAHNISS